PMPRSRLGGGLARPSLLPPSGKGAALQGLLAQLRDVYCVTHLILLHDRESVMVGRRGLERDSRKIVRRLEAEGWVLVKTSGSHHKFKHPARKHHIVVAHPVKDMPT